MICHRCRKETNIHTMSMFNTDEICMACKDTEKKHPDYDKARDADHEQVLKGHYNFKGIGWPVS
mgnify:FL=1